MALCCIYLEVVGGEGTDDLWRDIHAWRAGQREAAVQIFAAHCLLHQPANKQVHQLNHYILQSEGVNLLLDHLAKNIYCNTFPDFGWYKSFKIVQYRKWCSQTSERWNCQIHKLSDQTICFRHADLFFFFFFKSMFTFIAKKLPLKTKTSWQFHHHNNNVYSNI